MRYVKCVTSNSQDPQVHALLDDINRTVVINSVAGFFFCENEFTFPVYRRVFVVPGMVDLCGIISGGWPMVSTAYTIKDELTFAQWTTVPTLAKVLVILEALLCSKMLLPHHLHC